MTKGRAGRRAGGAALRVATYGVLASLALVFGWVETFVPAPVPVPGVKLGRGNFVVLYCLEALGARAAVVVMLVKVMASALLFGNPTVFAYSLAGGVVSLAAMVVALRTRAFSVVGVSVVGGVFHMAGQLAVVAVVLTPQVGLAYLPVLLVRGIVTGVVVGLSCRAVLAATASSSVLRERRKQVVLAARRADDMSRGRVQWHITKSSKPAVPSDARGDAGKGNDTEAGAGR